MTKIVTVIAMITVAVSATICNPEFFAKNRFLESLITFEILSVLGVILTVTLASIANIHLSLNRIVRIAFRDRATGAARADLVRREINQNGWVLVGLFVSTCLLLFLKGWAPEDHLYVRSFVNSMGLTILFTNLLILCDIYQVIYKLVKLDGNTQNPPPGDQY